MKRDYIDGEEDDSEDDPEFSPDLGISSVASPLSYQHPHAHVKTENGDACFGVPYGDEDDEDVEDEAEGGSSGCREGKGEGEGTEGKSQRERAAVGAQRQRPATACGGRASDVELPEGWLIRTSRSSGKSFYYHPASKTTQWQHP